MSLFTELKRRNVFRVAAAYAVVTWLVIEVADTIFPRLTLPDWTVTFVMALLLLGFPVAVFLAWAFELTPEGIKPTETVPEERSIARTTGQKLNYVIIAGLALALGYFVWESRFAGLDEIGEAKSEVAEAISDKSVAVLPFVNMSSDEEQEYFADGLTEEILNSLARLPELKVTSRTSSFHFKGRDDPIHQIAATLGVSHLVEGSIRRAGDQLRVTAQLVRAEDGFHLWSETYDRPANDIFEVQEDIAENIATALDIFLDDEKRSTMFAAGTRNVAAFEAFLKGRMLYDRGHRVFSSEDRWEANRFLEQAILLDPAFSAAYSLHHDAYAHFLMQDMPADDPGLTDAEALDQIRQDFAEANRYARDTRLQMSTQLSAAIFSESWSQVPEAVDELEAFVDAGRVEIRGPGWSHMLLVSMGRADLGLRRAQNEILNDPLDPLSYSNAAGAALALGDIEAALDFVHRGYGLSPNHTFLRRTEAIALALRGDLDGSTRKMMQIEGDYLYRPLAQAFLGNHARARSMALEHAEARPRDGSPIWVFAELGDEAEVTRLTRKIDSTPVGALSFLRLIYYSGGHVTFDMDAATNFRARLREAGVDPASLNSWVPVSTATGTGE